MNYSDHLEVLERAEALAHSQQFDEAVALCDEVLVQCPDHAAALNLKGFCLAESGRVPEALPLFKLARLYVPSIPSIRYNLGKALEETGDAKGALAEYDEALKLNGDYADARIARITLRDQLGDQDGALADLDEFVRRNPNHGRAYMARGGWQLAHHRPKAALPDLIKAVELDPSLQTEIDALGVQLGYKNP